MIHNTLFAPAGGGWWRLLADVEVQTEVYGRVVEWRSEDGSLVAMLRIDGTMRIAKGYIHDGASGPAIDTDNVLLASLVHDILYWFGRRRWVPWSVRVLADFTYYKLLLDAGVKQWRATTHHLGVRIGGARSFGLFAHAWAALRR